MSTDINEINQILKQHFEKITPEEFKNNLKVACPSLFDDSNQIFHERKETIHSTEDFLSTSDDIEYQEINRILTEHFKNITPEEFKRNLEIACPDLINGSKIAQVEQQSIDII